jgi:hypothetical protein
MATVTIFQRLNQQRRPTEAAIEQPHKNDAPQILLDFIQRWKGSTITWKEIRNFAPRSVRDRETAIRSAQVLVAHGWLTEVKPHQWQIIRQTLVPTRSQ